MALRPTLETGPAEPAVSLSEAKIACSVEHSEHDDFITSLVAAATEQIDGIDGILNRCIVSQTWVLKLDAWPSDDCARLPFPDVASVTVEYYDADNVSQTVSSSLYELLEDSRSSYVKFLSGFSSPSLYADRTDKIEITMVAGFGDADAVPSAIKSAIKMLVAHWYNHREAVAEKTMSEVPMAFHNLIARYRRIGL